MNNDLINAFYIYICDRFPTVTAGESANGSRLECWIPGGRTACVDIEKQALSKDFKEVCLLVERALTEVLETLPQNRWSGTIHLTLM